MNGFKREFARGQTKPLDTNIKLATYLLGMGLVPADVGARTDFTRCGLFHVSFTVFDRIAPIGAPGREGGKR